MNRSSPVPIANPFRSAPCLQRKRRRPGRLIGDRHKSWEYCPTDRDPGADIGSRPVRRANSGARSVPRHLLCPAPFTRAPHDLLGCVPITPPAPPTRSRTRTTYSSPPPHHLLAPAPLTRPRTTYSAAHHLQRVRGRAKDAPPTKRCGTTKWCGTDQPVRRLTKRCAAGRGIPAPGQDNPTPTPRFLPVGEQALTTEAPDVPD
jgi:hypothetical protein